MGPSTKTSPVLKIFHTNVLLQSVVVIYEENLKMKSLIQIRDVQKYLFDWSACRAPGGVEFHHPFTWSHLSKKKDYKIWSTQYPPSTLCLDKILRARIAKLQSWVAKRLAKHRKWCHTYTGLFLGVLAKTQLVQNAKTQFENTKTQFENAKTQFKNWKSPLFCDF